MSTMMFLRIYLRTEFKWQLQMCTKDSGAISIWWAWVGMGHLMQLPDLRPGQCQCASAWVHVLRKGSLQGEKQKIPRCYIIKEKERWACCVLSYRERDRRLKWMGLSFDRIWELVLSSPEWHFGAHRGKGRSCHFFPPRRPRECKAIGTKYLR